MHMYIDYAGPCGRFFGVRARTTEKHMRTNIQFTKMHENISMLKTQNSLILTCRMQPLLLDERT